MTTDPEWAQNGCVFVGLYKEGETKPDGGLNVTPAGDVWY
jgi:hypothetical protein